MFFASVAACSGVSPAEGQHFGDVVDVLLAELDVLVAGAGVVVALGEAEAGLIDEGDLLGGVLEVLHLTEAEEDVDAVALELAGERGEAVFGRPCRSGRRAAEWTPDPFWSMTIGVHAGGVVIADLLLVGGLLVARVRVLCRGCR